MKLKFLGVNGALVTGPHNSNSNMMLTASSGAIMLLDFGRTAPDVYCHEWKKDLKDIDALWISHLHNDHIGGLELLAFSRMFMPRKDHDGNPIKPKLYAVPEVMGDLWEKSLRGGLESIEGRIVHLTDYFDCRPVERNTSFVWEGYTFQPVQTIHVVDGFCYKHSYGLIITSPGGRKTFITTDTQFAPDQLAGFIKAADVVFHDCETGQFESHVHAHYNKLCTLDPESKAKIWLYHHAPDAPTTRDAIKDGFMGFVTKGQEFEL